MDSDIQFFYDTIIFYCPVCQEKNNVQVIHGKATNTYFQSTNIPPFVAVSIVSQKIYCKKCTKTLVIGFEDIPVRQYNLSVKLDCSDDFTGMESWYEMECNGNNIPRASNEEYS